MLYDNTLLCYAYLETYQCTGNADFARVTEEILTYVLRDITHKAGNSSFSKMAKQQLQLIAGEAFQYPAGYTYFMMAIDYYFAEKAKVVIVGSAGHADTQAMLEMLRKAFLPGVVTEFYDLHEEQRAEYKVIDGKATAYICTNCACRPPITDIEKLGNILKVKKISMIIDNITNK